eukprot:c26050_g1_i4 orf=2948-4030(+)
MYSEGGDRGRERERESIAQHSTAIHTTMLDIRNKKLACIDLSNPDLAASAANLRQACMDTGFFYLINHGISQNFMDEVFDHSRKFFALPDKEKVKVFRNECSRGYTPFLDEVLDPDTQSKEDFKEGYYIGVDIDRNDPRYCKPLSGPNEWPNPALLPNWRETMEKYHAEALKVGRRLAHLIALALNLEAGFFDQPGILDNPDAVLRLLHYKGEESNPELGVYGAGAHSDWGLLTLLATDDVLGLQICKDKDTEPRVWEHVPAVKGAYIVNIGDMLERWSNGLFRSTLHRVLLSGEERYSIPFFVNPNIGCLVECLPTCISNEIAPKYSPTLSSEYIAQRYRETHGRNMDYFAQHCGGLDE